MKKIFFIISLCLVTQLVTSQEKKNNNKRDRMKDLPKNINITYGTDIIPDEETALKYTYLIFKSRYINVSFEDMKPYIINLTANGKVWEVKALIRNYKNKYYIIRINKNTGEILNIWLEGKGDLTRT